MKDEQTYEFKKGQEMGLDDIYNIQGLGSGHWWHPISEEFDDTVVIVKDIKITIIIEEETG